MKFKTYMEKKTIATPEMIEWYEGRTKRHISLVGKYCTLIAEKFPQFEKLRERLKVHDNSKFEAPERDPYVFISWKYRCQDFGIMFNPPSDIVEQMHNATLHHVLNNSHHPEYWLPEDKKTPDIINSDNRDRPPENALDVSAMPLLDIAEMVADWCAVSEEKKNSPRDWADMNIGTRWKFTPEQTKLIYKIIEGVWNE